MNWSLVKHFGVRFGVVGAGGTVGAAYAMAVLTPITTGLVALGLLGLAGILLVFAVGTSGASTATAANDPGGTAVVTPEDAGVGDSPPGGLRPLLYAVGLVGWSLLLLVLVWIGVA